MYVYKSRPTEDTSKKESKTFSSIYIKTLRIYIEERRVGDTSVIKMMKGASIHLFVVLVLVVSVSVKIEVAMAAINCNSLVLSLAPCVSYVIGSETSPSTSCCSGVESFQQQTQNPRANHIAGCNCIKNEISSISSQYIARLATLPSTCGVSLGYTISSNINCDLYLSLSLSLSG